METPKNTTDSEFTKTNSEQTNQVNSTEDTITYNESSLIHPVASNALIEADNALAPPTPQKERSVLTIDDINKLKKEREETRTKSREENKLCVHEVISRIVLNAMAKITTHIVISAEEINLGIKKAIAEDKTEYTYKIAEYSSDDMYFKDANCKFKGFIWSTFINQSEAAGYILEFLVNVIRNNGRDLFGYIPIEQVKCVYNNILGCYELVYGDLFRRVVDLPLLMYYNGYLDTLKNKIENIESPHKFHFVDNILMVTFKW